MADVTKCKSCGAAILFAKTESGKTMPLDAEPTLTGHYMLGDDGVAYYRKNTGDAEVLKLRTSHFATCPEAARFRKAK